MARLLARKPSSAETRAHRIIGALRLPPLDLDGCVRTGDMGSSLGTSACLQTTARGLWTPA